MENYLMAKSTHLTLKERQYIEISLSVNRKKSQIAKDLKRTKSCISKEIKHNTDHCFGFYSALVAQNIHIKRIKQSRRKHAKINKIPRETLHEILRRELGVNKGSPINLVHVLRVEDCINLRLSSQSVYRYIAYDRSQGGTLYKMLPRMGRKHRRKAKSALVKIKDKISIDLRPSRDLLKLEAGHYEIDTIYGKDQESFLLTIVDISTLYTIIIKLPNKEAATTEKALTELFSNTLLPLKSITSDNGGEFANHKSFSEKFGISWYFCHPYCSWERGMNENTNGLIRRHFPKGTDFNQFSEVEILSVQNILNNRHRKRLEFETPAHAMVRMLGQVA
jgi:transposase, IS30 family